MPANTDLLAYLINTADLADARIYDAQEEKFIHCLEVLGLSLRADGDQFCDHWVNLLEDRYDALLDQADIQDPWDIPCNFVNDEKAEDAMFFASIATEDGLFALLNK